ncbi:DUF4286 family protein [Pedobacter chinensis]|nr:DUF4286 family protein [Pedobacter chinensis]
MKHQHIFIYLCDMFLYNVTLILDDHAAEEWLQWMQEIHIPEVMATGMFVSNRLLKVVDSPNEGVTYCAQYVAETLDHYNEYQSVYAPALQEKLNTKFKNRFVAYRTLMEFIG